MRIYNVHERTLPMPAEAAWRLVESLGGPEDRLWPADRWPAMRIEGERGHHGFIRYRVVGREPGARLRFRFRDMPGLDGEHAFDVLPAGADASVLRHVLDARASGSLKWGWRAIIHRMHDALLEDLLDRAEGRPPRPHGLGVRVARRLSVLRR